MQIDKTWHLAQDELDNKVTELEIQLWRVFYGFLRWQEECDKSANRIQLTGHDLSVLHVVRMQEKPKTSADIGRLLNRNDIFNIKYSIQKLLKMSLVERVKNDKLMRATCYRTTDLGMKYTNNYAEMRKLVLIDLFNQNKDLDLDVTTKLLKRIKSIYDDADHVLISYRNASDPGDIEGKS